MKKIITILTAITLLTVECVFAQTPQAFKYQAIARDNSGNILVNQSVSFRISILQGSTSGPSMYTETQTATTNQFGLANLNIGMGTVVSGNFSTISWGSNSYFVKMEFDPTGASNFTLMGTSQLLSVPYALYSGSTGDTTMWKKNGQKIYYSNGNVGIGTNNPLPLNNLDVVSTSGVSQGAFRSSISHSSLILGSGGNNFDSYILLRRGNGLIAGWSIFRKGSDNQKLVFRFGETPNVNEHLTIDTTGKVGIGTTPGNFQLTVKAAIEINGGPYPDILFNPNVNATKTGTIHQSADRLTFGASNVANIGYIDLNAPASSFWVDVDGSFNVNSIMKLVPINTAPLSPTKGTMYFDGTINKLRVYDGTTWQNCW